MYQLTTQLPQGLQGVVHEVELIDDNKISNAELQKMVKKHSYAIVCEIGQIQNNIELQQYKIQEAKEIAIQAKELDKKDTFGNWFKQTISNGNWGTNIVEERSKLNTKAILSTNEALVDMNQIIRSIITLVSSSTAYANFMVDELDNIIKSGFCQANKQKEKISDFTSQALRKIREELERQRKLNENIANNKKLISANAESISANKESILQNAEFITQNRHAIKNIKILAWLAIMLSLASLGLSVFSFVK